MTKKTLNLLLLAGAGAYFWWWIQRGKTPLVPETRLATQAPVGTDSMLPGVMPAAVHGVVQENGGLSCLGCR